MNHFIRILSLSLVALVTHATPQSLYDIKVKDVSGQEVSMAKYKGRVLVIVNTASQCGFTPQLKGLEQIYQDYKTRGLDVLAFPSHDFKQDPESNASLHEFAKKNYAVTFPFFEKNPVTGDQKQPVYQYLVKNQPPSLFKEVNWNFVKFIVNRKGQVVERFSSVTAPDSAAFKKILEKTLNEP